MSSVCHWWIAAVDFHPSNFWCQQTSAACKTKSWVSTHKSTFKTILCCPTKIFLFSCKLPDKWNFFILICSKSGFQGIIYYCIVDIDKQAHIGTVPCLQSVCVQSSHRLYCRYFHAEWESWVFLQELGTYLGFCCPILSMFFVRKFWWHNFSSTFIEPSAKWIHARPLGSS